jgi:uncharacterized protein YjiS (DUF1127 family)
MPPIINTYRPLHRRLFDAWRERFGAGDDLRGLDARMLADIGIHASEINSIEAEASTRVQRTRRRIVLRLRHG